MKDFYSSTTIPPSAAVATRPRDLRVNEYAAYSRRQLFANAAIKRIAAAVATSREGRRDHIETVKRSGQGPSCQDRSLPYYHQHEMSNMPAVSSGNLLPPSPPANKHYQ